MNRQRPQKHRAILVFVPIAVSIFLRIYPSFFNGAPWGTDGWPLLRITNQLLIHTPTALGANPLFDNYNIFWPGVSIFGAISSLIFDSPPLIVIPIIIPLVSAMTTLFIFVLAEKMSSDSRIACVASLIFATSSFDSIFTASVTKETYAEPLFMVGILLLFMLMKDFKIDPRSILIFGVISFAMAMSHHAVSFIFAILAFAMTIGLFVPALGYKGFLPRRYLILPLIAGGIIGAYVLLYASVALPFQFTATEILNLCAFLGASLAVAIYYILASEKKVSLLIPVIIFVVGVGIFVASEFTSVVPFAPLIPTLLAFYAIPYLIAGGLVIFGYLMSKRNLDRSGFSFMAIWISVPVGLFGFAVFATDQGVVLYRLFTFLYQPVAIFSSIALIGFLKFTLAKSNNKLFKGTSPILHRLAKSLVVAVIVVICLLSSYQSFAAVVQNQNLLGGQWAYKPSDLSAGFWTNASLPVNATISGDTKIQYLLGEYLGLSVNVDQGYTFLTSKLGQPPSTPLVTYQSMNQNGYNLFLYGEPLQANWQSALTQHSSLVYDNGNDKIWG